MKVGDLVKLCTVNYPRHKEETGMLINRPRPDCPKSWAVMIAGKMQSYAVKEEDMAVINESR